MGKYAAAAAKTGLSIPGPGACPTDDQIPRLLAYTCDDDPKVRRLALKHLCPCRMQRQRDQVWERVFEMTLDPDPGVRRDAVHAMTDGSPREMAPLVMTHLEPMLRDPDPQVRKYVRRTLDAIRRSGRVNVN
jgi:vesicle coat complex subunit